MSRYIPNTEKQQKDMLDVLALASVEELFADIPKDVRLERKLDLPDAMSEMELITHMQKLASKNGNLNEYACFLGAGAYDHYIPSVVGHILSRQEFYTAYTPYQPEISQGVLQAIFEYQTMICELTGMDAANASMYDGASALAEAVVMACQATRRKEVLVYKTVHPETRAVLHTYARFNGSKIIEVDYKDGSADLKALEEKISSDTAAVVIQSPNFFGAIEALGEIGERAHQKKALLIVSADPISLGILKSPGELGADIVVGEGQSLGNAISFGGPYLGFFATTQRLVRKMPGRVVGETTDQNGSRGFVLTLQTREQHIRREKATSNICSNQALNALAATVYLTALGKQGLKQAAMLCMQKAHYAYEELIKTGQFTACFSAPFFKEFAVRSRRPVEALNRELLKEKIIGGYALGKTYCELKDSWLLAVTEKRTKEEIDRLVERVGNGETGIGGGTV
ncbi:MAG: aminomethyl-transferring glycine dehydrogenase subunit GcvPA [Firmicutes bacterium]|nr:aminomethyl-transferring glycine dehydrogenase subunit GcvPA [Bacillota bacterium]